MDWTPGLGPLCSSRKPEVEAQPPPLSLAWEKNGIRGLFIPPLLRIHFLLLELSSSHPLFAHKEKWGMGEHSLTTLREHLLQAEMGPPANT